MTTALTREIVTTATRKTGIVLDPRYADHCTAPGHPECSQRLDALQKMAQAPDMRAHFRFITPSQAEKEALLAVHSPDYIQCLTDTEGLACTYLDDDTQTSPFSHETARLAAGGLCRAIELVQAGELDNAFALVRPPGHHAERSKAMGFCLYNNVAVGVRYAQNHLGLKRIMVVDWDLHHGNGTQHCFEDDPTVLFCSTHQVSSFPGSGKLSEIGQGSGRGLTINLPLLAGSGDGEYTVLFEKVLKPIALEFKPELILVSAGFDIHVDDPLGGMRMTPQGFAALTRSILDTAEVCCQGKVVMSLEGGYDLKGLAESVKMVLREMAGLQKTDLGESIAKADAKRLTVLLSRIRRIHGGRWPRLAKSLADDRYPEPSVVERLIDITARAAAYLKN